MAVTSFASIDAQCNQESNPGGLTRVLIANHRNFTADWPVLADLDVANVLDTEPPLAATKTFIEYLVPDGTASADWDQQGDSSFESYQHMVELMLAGFSTGVRTELKKMINSGCVVVVEMKDEQYVVYGSVSDPIRFKASFKSGKKGNEKRGATLKGVVDGMRFLPPVLSGDVVTALPITAVA